MAVSSEARPTTIVSLGGMVPARESIYAQVGVAGGVVAQAVVGLVALGLFAIFVLALSAGATPPGNEAAPATRHSPGPVAGQRSAAVPPDRPAVCAPGTAPTSTNFTPHTVYIVGSEERARLVWSGIHDSNAILRDLGLPPLLDEVVVAASSDDLAIAMAAINAANRVLLDLYGVENLIVDLRGQPGG